MCNIQGKMNNNIKSRIVYTDAVSYFIPSLNGVRQLEHVSLD